ncbi:MAG: hypothetical protein FWE67_05200 [Planctomycetaceae bacterium]|nr:hypothetical protein [Planctomycetaceae bacterium]
MSIVPLKIATIRNNDAGIVIYYNQYSGGAEYWERIIVKGDEIMKEKFDLFVKVNIFSVTEYFPHTWGKSLYLARMYANAAGYELEVHTGEKGGK